MPPLQPAGKTLNPDEKPPSHLVGDGEQKTWWQAIKSGLNFYRIHLIFFTFTPIIASGVFYASNGEIHIPYIDCLFNCVSAMTVCGLATSNLSTLTGWQQTILFLLMLCGSPVSVSVVMIAVRRHFFRTKFKHIIAEQRRRRHSLEAQNGRRRRFSFLSGPRFTNQGGSTLQSSATAFDDPKNNSDSLLDKLKRVFTSPFTSSSASSDSSVSQEKEEHRVRMQIENKERKNREKQEKRVEKEKERGREKKAAGGGGFRTSMIRRVDGEIPMLINPSGQMGGLAVEREETGTQEERDEEDDEEDRRRRSEARSDKHGGERVDSPVEVESMSGKGSREDSTSRDGRVVEDPTSIRRSSEPHNSDYDPFPRSKTIAFDPQQVNPPHQHTSENSPQVKHFPRTATIEFGGNTGGRDDMGNAGTLGRRVNAGGYGGPNFDRSMTGATRRSEATGTVRGPANSMFPRSSTVRTQARSTKHSGFGGFPMPHEIIRSGMAYFFPQVEQRITRTLTMPRTATFASARSGTGSIGPGKPVPYISFDAVVGRNSQFKDLSSEQLEELGGVEYRALKVLMWIVPSYLIFIQLSGWIIFWPYIGAKGRYNDVFEGQPRVVPIGWFSIFQSVSAFSNTGMSLVDTSMIPFQEAYLMILYIIFLILAGNTAYPIFLRFTIWTISRITPITSRLHETCRFLLDHPRRCYIYLFPSHQTMFLLMIIVVMSVTDWVSFLVLDIGTPAIESIPVGDRIVAGFLQSAAVRAAGFAIVPLAALAPAVKVLYTIMMYVSVYPIAMSVRATNVYEERSLGLFDDQEEGDEDEEEAMKAAGESKMVGWTRYLAFHARRQLAFDIWWLGLALWLVCIIERGAINNPANESYFNIFAILFELVSAYGTVGLSLGVSYDNFSLSGGFRPLAKLVVCAVMIRGRHRGLPVAIDRAVMLPTELLQEDQDIMEEQNEIRRRRSSILSLRDDSSLRRRRDSSYSASIRLKPSQPFFPPSSQPTGESAIDDDDEPPSSSSSVPPKVHHHHPPPAASSEFSQWQSAVGRGANQGSLTPVRESTAMSRVPSMVDPIDVGEAVKLAEVKREEEKELRS